jgi:uncharacterized protein
MHCRASPGEERSYEILAKGMLSQSAEMPGYLFSTLIPPRAEGEEFLVVQSFPSQAALDAWGTSQQACERHECIKECWDQAPEYTIFNAGDLGFSASGLATPKQPPRWRMAFVIWLGILP